MNWIFISAIKLFVLWVMEEKSHTHVSQRAALIDLDQFNLLKKRIILFSVAFLVLTESFLCDGWFDLVVSAVVVGYWSGQTWRLPHSKSAASKSQ
jgi:hypothetical protein